MHFFPKEIFGLYIYNARRPKCNLKRYIKSTGILNGHFYGSLGHSEQPYLKLISCQLRQERKICFYICQSFVVVIALLSLSLQFT